MSPSAMNTSASRPSSVVVTFSASQISTSRFKICLSERRPNRRIAERLFQSIRSVSTGGRGLRTCNGSMILLDVLHANAKRVVEEYNSISLRNACCAASVMLMEELTGVGERRSLKDSCVLICLVKDDYFMPPWRQCHFLLGEGLDPGSDRIYATRNVSKAQSRYHTAHLKR